MKDYKNTMDKLLDELITDAACAAADLEGAAAQKQFIEEIEFSDNYKKKMEKLFKAQRRKENMLKFSKHAKRAACILIAVVIASTVSIFSVDAWRIKFMNFVFESDAPNTDFSFGDDMQQRYADENISLNYIPSGFELTEKSNTSRSGTLIFKNGKNYFSYRYTSINNQASVDTENGTVEAMIINGMEAVYISTPRVNSLVWHNDKNSFIISSTISKEEIVKIAENSKKL